MSRRKANANVDISIRGDELEQHRIQLEHNLQHTDLSLHLSSPDVEDVEFPRHNSGPEQFTGFASFDQHSPDHFDPDENSHYNAWSYRTVDDEDAVDPYSGQTISTAAHHASALTLSAGLGGRGARRDISLSGAEYDPDRPLQGIVAGITSRISAFNLDETKSRNVAVDFDPLVADDSAEFAEFANRKHHRRPPSGHQSSSTSSSSSRPETPLSPRPTLSDALSSVAFSPKRPRSNQPLVTARQTAAPASTQPGRRASRTQAKVTVVDAQETVPTYRSRSKANSSSALYPQQSLSYATALEPEVNVLPPTPPNGGDISHFTKTARGVNREIESEMNQNRRYVDSSTPAQISKKRSSGKTATEYTGREPKPAHPRVNGLRTPFRDRVRLPDVTGLTSAIESPARARLEYLGYDAKDDAEISSRLAATLTLVQAKLAHLEAENSISRRRVRELEAELDGCKQEVARERTKVFEREQMITQQRADVRTQKQKMANNVRIAEERASDAADKSRYKEVVEEQKALQALVVTLKGHLTRLTAELADHHRLLEELRSLRDTDVNALKDKSRDVDNLRQEVERLGGEVEVLRGVVEEGLKERREVREQSAEHSRSSHSDSKSMLRPAEESLDLANPPAIAQRATVESDDSSSDDGHSNPSPTPSPQHRSRLADRTMRTDQATIGSPPGEADITDHPFIDSQEIERISEEVSERRVERSGSVSTSSTSQHRSHSQLSIPRGSPAPSLTGVRGEWNGSRQEPDDSEDSDAEAAPQVRISGATRAPSPSARRGAPHHQGARASSPTQTGRPKSASDTAHKKPPPDAADAEPPFPQIRGAYLERLFFSAPDHHANTCTVCSRRQRRKGAQKNGTWGPDVFDQRDLKERLRDAEAEGGNEGGPVQGWDDVRTQRRWSSSKGKERAYTPDQTRLPPQTVLARVLRELEDDFTHYKEIYIELADQYKVIDPVSNVAKRNVLAEHLREVIDVLEQKGDQIASLYDLLTFKDKPAGDSDAPHQNEKPRTGHFSESAKVS